MSVINLTQVQNATATFRIMHVLYFTRSEIDVKVLVLLNLSDITVL